MYEFSDRLSFACSSQRRAVGPAWLDGQLQVVRWCNRRGQSRGLPCTAWTWFAIREGVKGVVVRDQVGRDVVYVLVEPASHYYQVMTRSPWMPALVGERI